MSYEEGNVLFNDTLNTFYLWLYGIGSYEEVSVTILLLKKQVEILNIITKKI